MICVPATSAAQRTSAATAPSAAHRSAEAPSRRRPARATRSAAAVRLARLGWAVGPSASTARPARSSCRQMGGANELSLLVTLKPLPHSSLHHPSIHLCASSPHQPPPVPGGGRQMQRPARPAAARGSGAAPWRRRADPDAWPPPDAARPQAATRAYQRRWAVVRVPPAWGWWGGWARGRPRGAAPARRPAASRLHGREMAGEGSLLVAAPGDQKGFRNQGRCMQQATRLGTHAPACRVPCLAVQRRMWAAARASSSAAVPAAPMAIEEDTQQRVHFHLAITTTAPRRSRSMPLQRPPHPPRAPCRACMPAAAAKLSAAPSRAAGWLGAI